MARGRKRDLTIPQTRALSQQRAYRDRKAQYISKLEERVQKVEDENARLREEIAELRLRRGADGNVGADAELRKSLLDCQRNLVSTMSSLSHFQHLISGQPSARSMDVDNNNRNKREEKNAPSDIIPGLLGILAAVAENSSRSDKASYSRGEHSENSRSLFEGAITPSNSGSKVEDLDLDPTSPNCCRGLIDCSKMNFDT